MFHPDVIAANERRLTRAYADVLDGGPLIRHSHDECWTRRDQLRDAVDAKGTLTRPLTDAEQTFILHERLLQTLDYRYWSERYAVIAKETQEAAPLTPRWASQDLFLQHLAAIELNHLQRGHPDGILVNVLKARQLGLSTETACILAHRLSTQTSLRGLIAGDVKEQSEYLFGMVELALASLPWWLQPSDAAHQTGRFWGYHRTKSSLRTAWGKSARGGLQEREKAKGNIGRGRTYGAAHLSELSTWERPEQLDDAFLPGVPVRARTFVVFESTAKGRYDWWHQHWNQAERGVGRFHNIFIPWYIEPDKYWLPPPEGWTPRATTLAHADEVERDSPRWGFGRTTRLTREQLYWYESTRQTYDDEGRGAEFAADGRRLATFYEEYPASPRDAFQSAGVSIFPPTVLDRLKTQESRPADIWYVEPASDIAQLRAWERARAAQREPA